ncbi:hypothetical protein QJS10_CPA08g01203 [Acorus calamus]|uniref:Uncharacterized protein n=1 Tax=Acorus calamus TaxID=4465 RepID=A0AAV9EH36_ACOCL|nr:hypothetical protein QJS10_CPA08g01203 [Acorus calamus]
MSTRLNLDALSLMRKLEVMRPVRKTKALRRRRKRTESWAAVSSGGLSLLLVEDGKEGGGGDEKGEGCVEEEVGGARCGGSRGAEDASDEGVEETCRGREEKEEKSEGMS